MICYLLSWVYRSFHVRSCNVYCPVGKHYITDFKQSSQKCLTDFYTFCIEYVITFFYYIHPFCIVVCTLDFYTLFLCNVRGCKKKKKIRRSIEECYLERRMSVFTTLHPMKTGISAWRRLNSAMETVIETWSSVRQVSLVGMNSSKLDSSSEVAWPWLSSIISTMIMTEQKQKH